MSVTITVDITCDKCGQWIHCYVGKPTARKAREIAKRYGWTTVRSKVKRNNDLCPKCSNDLKEISHE